MAGDDMKEAGFIERFPLNIANSLGNAQRIMENRVTAKLVVEKPRSREKATYPGLGSRTCEGHPRATHCNTEIARMWLFSTLCQNNLKCC